MSIKHRPELIMFDQAWKWFSLYIRFRDKRCITCQKIIHYKQSNAGHYIHKSRTSSLYFNEFNVHKQCVNCNLWNSGRLDRYSLKIIELYGVEKLKELHKLSTKLKKWKLKELTEIRDKYKILAEDLLKNTL